ncbi:phage tail protein, partial [Escherichia coli]
RTDAASACAGVNCAGMSAILAVSFPSINFRSNGLCPPSGGFFI